jgi:hypothetical protein
VITHGTQTCGVHYYLVQLAHLSKKLVHSGTLLYVHIVPVLLDFDRNDEVWIWDGLITRQIKSRLGIRVEDIP